MTENIMRLLWDLRRAKKQGRDGINRRKRARLAESVSGARANSPYYRELYRGLPDRVEDPTLLPVTTKKALMARFDDWCIDREITLEKANSFVGDPNLIGEQFLGKYTLLTTSGTTGTRGMFVLDDRTMAVTHAVALRTLGSWLGFGHFVRILARRGRMSMVMATGGHFSSAVAAARLHKRRKRMVQILSVHAPLQDLVTALNEFRPAIVAPYASMAVMLASEQEAGRLRITPALLTLAAEGLSPGEYERIAKAFDAKVGNSYAATECFFLSYSCVHGWLHVNSDWVAFEGVDADYKPVPPGEQSHTVLISNLANRVQPILRYDLGDSILERPDSCPCGNPLPAIRVQGRSAEVLTLLNARGEKVRLAPLVFSTVADRIPGIELFQIVQTTPKNLRVRTRLAAGAEADVVWRAASTEIEALLGKHKLHQVTLERAEEPPDQSPGGKYRQVIPLSGT